MTYAEILKNARENMNGKCKVCRVCNGEACRGILPGPGGKGTGDGFVRAYQKMQEIKIHMDTLYEEVPIDTSCEFFGKTFKYPFFAAPMASISVQYGEKYTPETYGRAVLTGTQKAGTLAFTFSDGGDPKTFDPIKEVGGNGIPTVKPWPVEEIKRQFKLAEEAGCIAVATDIDGAGLAMAQGHALAVGPKSTAQIRELVESVKIPVLVKGIMTPRAAERCVEAGVYGIVISNHGGRVQDQTPAPVEMLPAIADKVRGKIKIFIDGGIRTGIDVFKVIALGADAALIGRPYPTVVYGGGAEAAEFYTNMIGGQLRETMMMTATASLKDIDKSKLFLG